MRTKQAQTGQILMDKFYLDVVRYGFSDSGRHKKLIVLSDFYFIITHLIDCIAQVRLHLE